MVWQVLSCGKQRGLWELRVGYPTWMEGQRMPLNLFGLQSLIYIISNMDKLVFNNSYTFIFNSLSFLLCGA